jgi:hypothetical protein
MIPFLMALVMAQAAVAEAPVLSSGPHEMSRSQIRAYNSRLSRDDPAYIRCRTEEETGSLVRAHSTCRTNAEWRRVEDRNNDEARDMVDHVNTSGSSHGT